MGALAQDVGCSSGRTGTGFLRCNISAVKDCAKWASCTLISKCDITSLSSLYKDCVEVLKGALYTVKQEGTKEGMAYVWSL